MKKKSKVKTFRVWTKSVGYCYIDIKAENGEDAVEKAKDIDGGDFTEDTCQGYWDVLEAEELKNANKKR